MGYEETICQICGVSFAITRIRRADESEDAAWDYTGSDFVEEDFEHGDSTKQCSNATGCELLEGTFEHIAGPRCISTSGYSGWRISVEEMQGCRAVQALILKDAEWTPEPDDQDFELEGGYFLSGVGDGSPDEAPLEDLKAVRHGADSVWISDAYDEVRDYPRTVLQVFD